MTESAISPVHLGERLVSATPFKALFREGMALVEQTAAYLDGDGRAEARGLERTAALAYATESMRLTTRLMQLASWLLLQRAVNEGEMTREQAMAEKSRVTLSGLGGEPDEAALAQIPTRLADLVRQSLRLQARLRLLEETLLNPAPPASVPENAVGRQIDRLRQAFSAG